MAFDFPSNPAVDDEFIDTATGATYRWNSFAWARKKAQGGAAASDFVLKAGDTMTGPLQLPIADPVAPTQATNKNWVETRPIDGGGYTFTVRDGQVISAQSFGQNYLPRWAMNLGDGDEADFVIQRYNDGGGRMGPAIRASRSTGVVDFDKMPTIKGKSLLEYLKGVK